MKRCRLSYDEWKCILSKELKGKPDGTILVDDMDELEDALAKGDITKEQFQLALDTSEGLQKGLLSDISEFVDFTCRCYNEVR